ncbi:hypothetical protein [Portibacter marinus]|uniref:hypothetical protein n=1 Tax=Portibacter marinus TaxID=2898660 RepID=UPI001F15C7B8|nr:hypothetical protein [Portibacter marinus]
MKIAVSTILIVVFLSSCANDGRVEPTDQIEAPQKIERTDKLPFACDFIDEKEMLSILDKDVNLEVLDGNRNRKSEHSTSCFYKWDDIQYDVSGVMIQINRNPLPDEIPNFVQKSLDNKRWEGERSYDDPNISFKYDDMEGMPFPVIYNRETNKYFFGLKDMFVCSVVFNYPAEPDQLDAWFREIATKIVESV